MAFSEIGKEKNDMESIQKKTLWVGITGGIASGKSTITSVLREQGYAVIDADEIAHQVVLQGTQGFEEILKTFGNEVIQKIEGLPDAIDREKLAHLIFSDESKKKVLENIVHPLVQKKVMQLRLEWESKGHSIVFYDVPLLFEKNLQSQFDQIILAHCRPETQIRRLIERNGLSEEAARLRLKNQWPLDSKIPLAHIVMSSEFSVEAMKSQLLKMAQKHNWDHFKGR